MSAILTSPEMICNVALSRIGERRRIGSMYEGSEQSKVGLDIYGQTRDTLLREGNWGFAERVAPLSLLKTAPANYIGITWSSTYPPQPWNFEYTYPTDCLKVRSLKDTSPYTAKYRVKAINFALYNDTAEVPIVKTILCNVTNAICVYTGQITDPTTFEVNFVETLIDELAKGFAPGLANLQTHQVVAQEETAARAAADMTRG